MRREWLIAGMIAVLFHGALLFGLHLQSAAVPLPLSDTAVDVNLVDGAPAAAAPATEPPAPPPPPPEPVPPPPTPPPEPPPETPPPSPAPAPVVPSTPPPAERPLHHSPQHAAHPNSPSSNATGSPDEHRAAVGPAATSGAGSSAVRARSNPKPPYPEEAKRLHQQGRVLLEVQVGADGRATSVTVRHSSGFPLLDNAAQQAVARWTFEPARLGGLSVPGRAEVPVNFSLTQ